MLHVMALIIESKVYVPSFMLWRLINHHNMCWGLAFFPSYLPEFFYFLHFMLHIFSFCSKFNGQFPTVSLTVYCNCFTWIYTDCHLLSPTRLLCFSGIVWHFYCDIFYWSFKCIGSLVSTSQIASTSNASIFAHC